jgi:glycine oxidase
VASSTTDIAVVGGGVIGCATAYELARRGASVVVVERAELAAESSSAAAGILAPRVHAADSAIFPLAMASHLLFPGLADALREETGVDSDFARCGALDLAMDEAAEETLRDKVQWLRAAGHDVSWIDPLDVSGREPALAGDCRGAFFDADAYQVQPGRFTQSLGHAAARRGVRFQLGTEVLGIERNGPHAIALQTTSGSIAASHIVLAAGAWMGALGERLGLRVPVFPAKGQILSLRAAPQPIRNVVFGADVYLMPRRDGTVAVGATVEDAGFDKRVTTSGAAGLLQAAARLCPSLADAAVDRLWAGLRPGTTDELPIVGLAPGYDNVTLAGGHFRNGIMLAPITASLLADVILDGSRPELLAPFDPARFASG